MYLPSSYSMPWMYAAGFIAFRFFDIVKPWPVGWIDRRIKGAWGIMLDDLAAAIMGVLTLGLLGHVGLAIVP